ncbi:hypothetical protein BTE77_34040 [Ensifer adhaerens]|nr:hypothetical protein BTE77_34040 [Ensifer adhaerens]
MSLEVRVTANQDARPKHAPSVDLPAPAILPGDQALFLSEGIGGLDEGAHFLDALAPDEWTRLRAQGRQLSFRTGETIFNQGDTLPL